VISFRVSEKGGQVGRSVVEAPSVSRERPLSNEQSLGSTFPVNNTQVQVVKVDVVTVPRSRSVRPLPCRAYAATVSSGRGVLSSAFVYVFGGEPRVRHCGVQRCQRPVPRVGEMQVSKPP
jgi:hypothetical protein